jgi:hypothetical protein
MTGLSRVLGRSPSLGLGCGRREVSPSPAPEGAKRTAHADGFCSRSSVYGTGRRSV